ncbi:MAG: peptide chain release factor aRF-1, partial [Nanoarchaeota archaeon]|nr:peptide chain release factor aRF-1 [Nanoarchaeota archaeon]
FCGNISQIEGQDDLRFWMVEPPLPLKTRLYRCDKEFVLEPLRTMMEVSEIYGLIVMDRKEATLGMLEGKRIEVLQKMTSGVPSKIRAGGQSSQRFHRITEGLTKEFYKRVAEEAKKCFFDNTRLKGIIVGGPIPTKDEFLDNDYLATQLQVKVIGRVDIGDVDESGLKELVEKSHELLAEQEVIYEKKLIQKFFQTLGENPDMAVYKEEDLRKALQYGAVDTLILTKDYPRAAAKELKDAAKNISAKIEIVSNETEEGKQFKNLSGAGALLRFGI